MTLPIEDRIGLQDLIADYSWALDTGDVEALVACFTPDARMVEEVFEDPDIWTDMRVFAALPNIIATQRAFPAVSIM